MNIILHMGDPYVIDNPCTKRMSAFADELRNRGHEVFILAPDTPGIEKESGVVYCKTLPLKKKTTIYRLINQGCLAFSSYRAGKRLNNIDIVLTTSPPPLISIAGAMMAKRHKAKLIYDVRDIWPDVALEMGSFSASSIYSRIFAQIRDYMLKKADLVTTVSKGKVNKLRAYNKLSVVECIPNGYNVNFSDYPINKELYDSIKSKGKIICSYIGNLGLAQGLRQYLQIAKMAYESELGACFIIYGSGAEERLLKQYVENSNIKNVFFEGRLPNRDMRTVLEASDINFVSLVNGNLKDSVPTKLYEALGVGCPVMLAAEGDSVDILNATGHGIAVSPNDLETLWDGFRSIIDNMDKFCAQKEHTRYIVRKNFSLQNSAKKIANLIEQL